MSATKTYTHTFRILGKCRVCQKVHTALAQKLETVTESRTGIYPVRSVREVWPAAVECCGRPVSRTPIKGRRTDTKCDERCTEATGHKCECACGGKNHGSAHD